MGSEMCIRDSPRLRACPNWHRPPGSQSVSDYVLRRPGKAERIELDIEIEKAADVVERLLREEAESIMNDFNRRER